MFEKRLKELENDVDLLHEIKNVASVGKVLAYTERREVFLNYVDRVNDVIDDLYKRYSSEKQKQGIKLP
jgi:hypothetical protein